MKVKSGVNGFDAFLVGGFPAGASVPTEISMILLSYNYNQPVSIILPLEAELATEVSIQ